MYVIQYFTILYVCWLEKWKFKYIQCKYNGIHLLPEPELSHHMINCPDRIFVERFSSKKLTNNYLTSSVIINHLFEKTFNNYLKSNWSTLYRTVCYHYRWCTATSRRKRQSSSCFTTNLLNPAAPKEACDWNKKCYWVIRDYWKF